MYNKLFTKILDSSIWMEAASTRLVWLTLLAAMDEDGFVAFASVANVAHRARVELQEAEKAMGVLEAPDPHSSDPENEGRRIERVDGGWMILNARKYRDLVTRTVAKENTRLRVAKYREAKRAQSGIKEQQDVTIGNDDVTLSNASVTPSEAVTYTKTETDNKKRVRAPLAPLFPDDLPDAYREPLSLWWKHKRETGKGYKDTGWNMLIDQQRQKAPDELLRDVKYSIQNNYQGIFSPQKNGHRAPDLFQRPCDVSDVDPRRMKEL